MSQRTKSRTGLLNVQIRTEQHQQAWKAAETAVANALGEDPEDLKRATVARELAEAYTGTDGCGQWRENE